MSNFNAGAIEASLTLGRTSWTKDLKKVQKEIRDLENTSIVIGIDADSDNAQGVMNTLEMMLENFEEKTFTPTLDLNSEEARLAIEALEAKLDDLDQRSVVVQVFADTDNAEATLDTFERATLDVLEHDSVTVQVFADVKAADAVLEAFDKRLDRLDDRIVTIGADADIVNAMGQLDLLENQMDVLELDDVKIQANADVADAMANLQSLHAYQTAISADDVELQVDVDAAKAIADLGAVATLAEALDGRDVDIDIDANRSMLKELVGDPGSEGGGYLGLFRILLYAIIALAPVLTVAISSATGAILGFAAATAGAIGPVAVLTAGIVGLVQRYNDAKDAGEEMVGPMADFAESIDALKSAWEGFLDEIEDEGFALMGEAVDLLAGVLPTLVPLFNATADAMSGVLGGIKEFVDSSEYQEMIDFFSGFGVDMLVQFMNIGGNLLQFFGRLFQALEPLGRVIMGGLEDVTAGWAEWADDLENNDSFQQFVANTVEYGPMLLDMLGSMLDAFMAISDALLPFSGPMLEGLTFLFDLIANAPTDVLTALIAGFAGLWLGLNVIGPVATAAAGGLSALAAVLGIGMAPLLLIIGTIAAFAAMLVYLWETNDEFRDAVIATWEAIMGALEPIVTDIIALIQDNWGPIVDWSREVWETVGAIITDAMIVIQQIVRGASAVIRAVWGVMGDSILDKVKIIFTFVANTIRNQLQIVRGIFQVFRGLFTGDWDMMWTGIKNIVSGAVNQIKNTIQFIVSTAKNMASGVKDAFNGLLGFFRGIGGRVSSAVRDMWDGIWDGFKSVLNKVIGAWNGINWTIDIPDKIPGLPDEFKIRAPQVPYLAAGAYLTEPTLNVAGEAGPEIVAPEPVLRQIVEDHSGSKIDYQKMAAAIAAVFAPLFRNMLTKEDLIEMLESAAPHVEIDARSEGYSAAKLAAALGFELRLLGYGGKANA